MKNLRTIEFSDPGFDARQLQFVTVKSKNLKGRGDIILWVPESKEKNMPVIILLHGVYGSAWSWPLKSGVHLTVKKMIQDNILPPVVLVFPSDGLWGDGSGYVPHDGYDFEKWIADDVPLLLRKQLPQVGSHSKFFITGLSMGGFGAMKIGAKYPDLFSAFSGHSSITNLQQMELFAEENISHYIQAEKRENDVFETILNNKDRLRRFRFDCGKDDSLFQANQALHDSLLHAGIDHGFDIFAGGHEWPYWKKHIENSIIFFAKEF